MTSRWQRALLIASALTATSLAACPAALPTASGVRFACQHDGDCGAGDPCVDGFCAVQAQDAGLVVDDRRPTDGHRDAPGVDRTVSDSASSEAARDDATADAHRDAAPDSAARDAAAPDSAVPDATVLDATVPDATVPDAAMPDSVVADAARPDAARPDAAVCQRWSLVFDGVDDYVEAPDEVGFDGLTAFTIEAWVHTNSVTADPTQRTRIVSHHDNNRWDGWSLSVVDGQFRLWLGTYNNWYEATADPMAADRWYHVAGSYDGTSLRIFVDGALVRTTAGPGTAPTDFIGPVRIGIGAADLQRPFNGGIDEVRLSRGARYVSSFVRPATPLAVDGTTVALWHLDDGPGQVARDATGTHAGWLGAASAAADQSDPTWVRAACVENR